MSGSTRTEHGETMNPAAPTMTTVPTLDELVSDPAKVLHLPGPVVQHLLVQVISLLPLLVAHAHQASTMEPAPHADRLLNVGEAAKKLGTTTDYLYRHADTLPFSVRVGTKQLRFSLHGMDRFIKQRRASHSPVLT